MASDITQRASGRCLNRDCSYSFDAPVSLLSFMLISILFRCQKATLSAALAHLNSRAKLFLTLASYDFIYVILYMFI